MRLIVEPENGVEPVLHALALARKQIDISIFRLAHDTIEKALEAAVARGVVVRALVAHRNGSDEKRLRKLEMRLLATGATVCRTDDDLVRYHQKTMIVDGTTLYVFGFNFTKLDIDKSRSFALATKNASLVREAQKLFEADCTRRPYTPGAPTLIVSPLNARERLALLIRKAQKRLLIYDPGLSDPVMLKLLRERVAAGVDVRIIGKVPSKDDLLRVGRYAGKRLHVRAIVQDGGRAFIGSQSLRKLELDKRREVGVVTRDRKVVHALATHFEKDWADTETGKKEAKAARRQARKEGQVDRKPSEAAGSSRSA
jgi:phosphatidylserine/phosphatidylglycerophosphate/cardiolipin synthase-like enzyme